MKGQRKEKDQIQSYKDLLVWQKGMKIVKITYRATKKLPKEEVFGLSNQMRRAAVSIPSNIAEGYQRKMSGDYKRFLNIAHGSLAELETQTLILEEEYQNIPVAELKSEITELQKMLTSLISKIGN
jgi:four helix bundle protein